MTGWPPDVVERQPARVMARLQPFWYAYIQEMGRQKKGVITPYWSAS